MSSDPIYVTRPDLPPLEEFIPYLEEIWNNKILTNGGPFHQQLEAALCKFLDVDHVSLFSNGTLALVTALQAMRVVGEVITTPYSFIATAHSLLWNGIKPVFVDVDQQNFNLDPDKIEAAITPQTTAILPVHCYGYPCDVSKIKYVADKYGLKVIYDAAHAFGVRDNNGSILQHGDLSILSFHATKVFNTFEGGAIICPDIETKKRIDFLKNFGIADETTVIAPGINGKMNEFQAAFGLLQLKYVDRAIERRSIIDGLYREGLEGVPGIAVPMKSNAVAHNYSYFPIIIEDQFPVTRDELYELFKIEQIYTRRYFYPLITEFPMYKGLPSSEPNNLMNATYVANRVLCLPIYPDLDLSDVKKIIGTILSVGK